MIQSITASISMHVPGFDETVPARIEVEAEGGIVIKADNWVAANRLIDLLQADALPEIHFVHVPKEPR